MKNLFLIISLVFVLCVNSVFAQIITTDPAFPKDTDEVILTFNAVGTDLENYNGDVFTHSGVILEGSSSWSHVIGDWGNNENQPQLTSLGNNLYELLITPEIRSFYSVGPSETISQLAFVFRSADGSTQTADLFVDVYESGLSIIITEPGDENVMAIENDTIPVTANSPEADSMFLFVNDELKTSIAGITLLDTLYATSSGNYWEDIWVKILAKNTEEMVCDSFSYFIIPQPEIEELPEGMVDGINYIDNTTVLLSLYAPYKDFAFVIGDFNDWEQTENFYMKKTPDGDRYWLQIENLEAGKEYIFQYFVDGTIRIGDPYADKVSDPWNDKYISNQTYPNLIDYPTGKTSGIATVLQTAQEPYEWQITEYNIPEVEDMVVYELLIRDFIATHDYNTLTDTIGYFKKLGVNVIELMPVNEFEGNLSWGYNPNYYFAPDKYYGTKNDLKRFIDKCHENDIAVVIDMVLNHSFGTSPNVLLYWNSNLNRPADNNPWYNEAATHDYNVGFDFDHESPQTREFVKRVNNYWLEEYKVDGYRFDLSKGFTQNYTVGNVSAWGNYDQSRIDIWSDYSSAMWETNPQTYVILEHFADNSEEKVLSGMGMMLWGNSNHNYAEATMGYNSGGGSDFSWISYKKRGWSQPHVMGYMESHDEERQMYKNETWGSTSNPGYKVTDTTIGLQRSAMAASFFFTIPGPKMVWQFGEMGYDYSINWPCMTGDCRTDPKPERWDYLNDYRRKYLFNVYASLIELKKNYDVFKTTDYSLSLYGAGKSIVLRHSSMNVVIIGNFNVTSGSITPNWPATGKWYNYFYGDSISITSTAQSIQLEQGEYIIYTDKKLTTPDIGTGIDDDYLNPDIDLIGNIYPNPSNNNFNIDFNLLKTNRVSIRILNLLGDEVKTITDSKLYPGAHSFKWDAQSNNNSRVRSGIYFCVFQVGDFSEVPKLVLNQD